MSTSNTCRRPHIGVGVIVIKDGKILLGKRIGAHGANTWSFPGGKLDFGEEIFDCAIRETLEETNIKIKNLRLGPYTNDYFKNEDIHYLTLYVVSEYDSGNITIMEPNKCLEWRFVEWDSMPRLLFLPIENLLESGFDPFK